MKDIKRIVATIIAILLVVSGLSGITPISVVNADDHVNYRMYWEEDDGVEHRQGGFWGSNGYEGLIATKWTDSSTLPTFAGRYYLTGDVTLTKTWNAPAGEVTICLNGHNIIGNGNFNLISTSSDYNLNIIDNINGSGYIGYSSYIDNTVFRINGGTTNIYSCIIKNGGTGIYSEGGTVNVYDVLIKDNSYGIANYGDNSTINVYNIKITHNSYGFILSGFSDYEYATVNMYGGEVFDNSKCGLFMNNYAHFNMIDGVFRNNSSSLNNWSFYQTGGSMEDTIDTKAPYKKITLMKNDGTEDKKIIYFIDNREIPLNDNIFTKENSVFKSWNTKPDGSGTDYTKIISADQTLYAQWDTIVDPDDKKEEIKPEEKKEETKEETKQPETKASYSNEWIDGKWYSLDGSQSYKPTGEWKKNSEGWYFEDTSGWFADQEWQKIDGDWYFFDEEGYMATNQYCGGWEPYISGKWWVGSDGRWDGSDVSEWHFLNGSWWFGEKNGWYSQNRWLRINGKWYYFGADGFMKRNTTINGYYVNGDGEYEE